MKENPQDYILDPLQEAALKLWTLRDNMNVNFARTQYATDIGLYTAENPGASYVSHINTNMDLVEQGLVTEARLKTPAIGKHRSYDTIAQRMAADDQFIPETDPRKLIEYHDNNIARMASQQVFKDGVGGMTRVEVLELARPELVAAKKATQKNLDSLKGMMERRLQKEGDLAAAVARAVLALDERGGEADRILAPAVERDPVARVVVRAPRRDVGAPHPALAAIRVGVTDAEGVAEEEVGALTDGEHRAEIGAGHPHRLGVVDGTGAGQLCDLAHATDAGEHEGPLGIGVQRYGVQRYGVQRCGAARAAAAQGHGEAGDCKERGECRPCTHRSETHDPP